ncbi:MAG: hypothetical protein ACJ790_06905 [Myxococcaceae bacterium]
MKSCLSMPLAALLFLSAPSFATTMLKQQLPELSAAADVVVRAKVTSVQSRWTDDHRRIVTDIQLEVLEAMKGSPAGTVTVVQPGGVVGDIGQRVDGVAEFKEGEECVVFLERRGQKVFAVVGMAQGKLNIERSSDGKAVFAVPSHVEATVLDPQTRVEVPASSSPMSLDVVRSTVRKTTP